MADNLPFEILAAIFRHRIKKVKHTPFVNGDIRDLVTQASLRLSHVSSTWRGAAHNTPELWCIYETLHPDLLAAFIKRTKESGLRVDIEENERPSYRWVGNPELREADMLADQRLRQFLCVLSHNFADIKALSAKLYTRQYLHHILACGRRMQMTKLRTLTFTAVCRINGQVEDLNEHEKLYGTDLLEWDMPSVENIRCRNILPVSSSETVQEVSLVVGSEYTIYLPWSPAPPVLIYLTSLSLPFDHCGIHFKGIHGTQTVTLPNLKKLSTIVRKDPHCDPAWMHHTSTFNRMRLPALETLIIRFYAKSETPRSWFDTLPQSESDSDSDTSSDMLDSKLLHSIHDVLASMPRLRTLEIQEPKVPLEDLLNASLFPCLETFTADWGEVKSGLFTAAWCSFPLSLRQITFDGCSGEALLEDVIPKLLRALDRRFGASGDRGRVEVIYNEDAARKEQLAATLRDDLGEHIVQRLTIH